MIANPLRVSIIGDRHFSGWEEDLVAEIREWFRTEDRLLPNCYVAPSYSVGDFPEGVLRHMEIWHAQEKIMASRSDIAVFVDDGKWDEAGTKKFHMRKLLESAPVFIIWTPKESVEPELRGVPVLSGIVNVYGSAKDVAATIGSVSNEELIYSELGGKS